MRSIWKGSLGFGLVNIPIKLYNTTEDKRRELALVNIHAECNCRVKMPKYCPKCEKMFSKDLGNADELVKAYEIAEGQYIPITDEDKAMLPLSSVKSISIAHFVPNDAEWLADPRWYKDTLWITPEEPGRKAFCLFLEAMSELDVSAISKITMREKEHLGVITPFEGLLCMEVIHWANELKPYDELVPKADISLEEMEMAQTLIKAMIHDIDPSAFQDEYYEAFNKIIAAKISGTTITPAEMPKPAAEKDLVDSLMASIKAQGAKASSTVV